MFSVFMLNEQIYDNLWEGKNSKLCVKNLLAEIH